MPIFGALLVAVMGGLLDFFLRYFSKRIAFGLAVAALLVAAMGTAFAAVKALAAGLVVAAPDNVVAVCAMFLPANLSACISAVLVCDSILYAVRLYAAGLNMGLK